MGFTKLNTQFDKIYTDTVESENFTYKKIKFDNHLTLEVITKLSNTGAGFSLICRFDGQIIRSKSYGPKPNKEIQWDMNVLIPYFQHQMDNIYDNLPPDIQAKFAREYVAVKDFVTRGKLSVARHIVETTDVGDNVTLKTIKRELLNLL